MVKKSYSKTGAKCRVTFKLPPEVNAQTAHVCGDFNDWDTQANPMKQLKDGGFSVSMSLETGQSYRYRYFLDQERWENDWEADAYVPNEHGTEDSLLEL